MGDLIRADVISDNTVYGVRQMQYTVDGVSGKDFADAVTIAAFRQSTAIEATAGSYSEVVRARQKKVSDLGDVLAYIAEATAKLPVKNGKSTDKVTVNNASWVRNTCSSYGITFSWDGDKMSRADIQKAQTEVQYQMDKEDNNLQQDIVSLQSYISKRDNAFSTAARVVRKSLNASESTIGNIGR